jgi:uncharacterized protein YecE (DUF72 family)
MIADILGDRMGCFLIQLPPSHHYTKAPLTAILSQLDPARRDVVGGTRQCTAAFRGTGTIFCSCSGPGLPDELVRTADDVYLRLHGPKRWYRHGTAFCESSADWPEGGQRACRLMNGTCKRMTFAHARLK